MLLGVLQLNTAPRLYWVIGLDTGWVTPTDAQIVAGTGYTAAGSENAPFVTTAPFTFAADATGLAAATDYRIAFVWFDGTTYSLVEQSAAFTTSAAAGGTGTLAVTLGALTLAGTGALSITGITSATLGALTSAATGALAIQGTLSQTLGTLTSASTGALAITGSLSGTLGALTLASTGTLPIVGSLSATLGAVTLAATGAGLQAGTGSLTATLGTLTAAATGSLSISGSLTATLGAITLAASGAAPRTATLTATLGALTLVATNIPATPRTRVLPSWYYVPGPMSGIPDPVRREFERVSQSTFAAAPVLQLQVLSVEPERPREGMVAYASGAPGWNPGAGAGVYVRGSAAWAKL